MAGAPDSFADLDIRGGVGYSLLRVRVTPRASRNEIAGVAGGALKLKIQAPPVEGAANDKAREVLIEMLGCPRSAVRLERGEASRDKTFRIDGMTPERIRAALLAGA